MNSINKRRTVYLSSLDGLSELEFEIILSLIEGLIIEEYVLIPEADIWFINYKNEKFKLKNDLDYGCELSSLDTIQYFDIFLEEMNEVITRYLSTK